MTPTYYFSKQYTNSEILEVWLLMKRQRHLYKEKISAGKGKTTALASSIPNNINSQD